MKNIFRLNHTANFTVVSNDLVCSTMPAEPLKILLYLLSKPETWCPNAVDIQTQLGMSAYAVRSAMQWLQANGYLSYLRLSTGHTVWKVFEAPEAQETDANPDIYPQAEKPRVENSSVILPQPEKPGVGYQPVLVTQNDTEKLKTNNNTTQLREQPIEQDEVVVNGDDGKVGELKRLSPSVVMAAILTQATMEAGGLASSQQSLENDIEAPIAVEEKVDQTSVPMAGLVIPSVESELQLEAKAALTPLSPDQIAAVLAIFTHAVQTKPIANKIGYLRSLVNACLNGTLSPPKSVASSTIETAADRVAKSKRQREEQLERGKISNAEYFAMMKARFGDKFKFTEVPVFNQAITMVGTNPMEKNDRSVEVF